LNDTLISIKGEKPITAVIAGKPDQLVETTFVLNGS
jgi:hypothetical protein